MRYIDEYRARYGLDDFTDDEIAAALPHLEPDLFGGMPIDQVRKLATQESSYLSGLGRLIGSGAVSALSSVARGAERAVGGDFSVDERLENVAEQIERGVDPLRRERMSKVGFREDSENSLGGILDAAAKSLGSMAAFAPSVAASVAAGAAAGTASLAPIAVGVLGGAVTNALMVGGDTYSGTVNEILNISDEELQDSPLYKEYLEKYKDPKEAKVRMASDLADEKFKVGAVAGAASGALIGPMFTRALTRVGGGLLRGFARGAVPEAAQEFVESGSQSLAQEQAREVITGERANLEAALRDALFGATLGAIAGGAPGAAAGKVPTPRHTSVAGGARTDYPTKIPRTSSPIESDRGLLKNTSAAEDIYSKDLDSLRSAEDVDEAVESAKRALDSAISSVIENVKDAEPEIEGEARPDGDRRLGVEKIIGAADVPPESSQIGRVPMLRPAMKVGVADVEPQQASNVQQELLPIGQREVADESVGHGDLPALPPVRTEAAAPGVREDDREEGGPEQGPKPIMGVAQNEAPEPVDSTDAADIIRRPELKSIRQDEKTGAILQNRNRSSVASIAQMASIASNPDYYRLSISRVLHEGAPVVIDEANDAIVAYGKDDVAVSGRGNRIPVKYAVVEAESLLPTNRADGSTIQEYSTGAPGKLRVIAGNGRVAGLQSAFEKQTAGAYVEALANDNTHGIPGDVIRKMRKPILVRIMPKEYATGNIADESNISGVSRLSPSEQALNDSRRISLDEIEFSDDGTINRKTVISFINSMPESERAELIDRDGQPTRIAYDRLTNAIFSTAYESDELIRLAAEAIDVDSRNIINALVAAAPMLARLKGAGGYDFRPLVTEAAEFAINAKRSDMRLDEYLKQADIMRRKEVEPILRMFIENIRSAKKIAAKLDELARYAILESSRPDEDMFGSVPRRAPEEIFREVFDEQTNEPQDAVKRSAAVSDRGGASTSGRGDGARQAGEQGSDRSAGEAETNPQEAARQQTEAVEGPRPEPSEEGGQRGAEPEAEPVESPPEMALSTYTEEDLRNQEARDIEELEAREQVDREKEYFGLEGQVAESAGSQPAIDLGDTKQAIDAVRKQRKDAARAKIAPQGGGLFSLRQEALSLVKEGKADEGYVRAHWNDADELQAVVEGAAGRTTEDQDNVAGTDRRLERDRADAEAADQVGEERVRPEGRGDAGSTGQGTGRAGEEEETGRPGGAGVSEDRAAVDGERGDQSLHPDGERAASEGGATGSRDSGRGDEAGEQGGGADTGATAQGLFSNEGSRGAPSDGEGRSISDQFAEEEEERIKEIVRQRSALQKKADEEIKDLIPGDEQNIKATLPVLLPEQQKDVVKAETRLLVKQGRGFLFANGTGTGKTFSGLGVAKRYFRMGKENILVVTTNQKMIEDWLNAAKLMHLPLKPLENTKDNGGSSPVVTTYANFTSNKSLLKRDWDLVVFDESHYLMQKDDFDPTGAVEMMRAITWHPRAPLDLLLKRHKRYPEYAALLEKRRALIDQAKYSEASKINEEANSIREEIYKSLKDRWTNKETSVLFLSATPFAYRKTLDYAEGFLFEYPPGDNGRISFFINNFGYRLRYNKLTEPSSDVDVSLLERRFADKLIAEGAMSSRMLEVEADYDRRFYLVTDAIGEKIDGGFSWLREQYEAFKQAGNTRLANGYGALYKYLADERFNYLQRSFLLEAIKASHIIPIIKKHIELGRKVVVFHGYNQNRVKHPFEIEPGDLEALKRSFGPEIADAYKDFVSRRKDLFEINYGALENPIDQFKKAFPNALFFNGKMRIKDRLEAVRKFNSDNSGHDLIVVQADAGREGISLHDTTGRKQRVLINISLPVRPVSAIQTEGRTYRAFVQSNAILRYVATKLPMERWAIAQKTAERASTAENLSLGSAARGLRESFRIAYEEASEKDYLPGHPGEGSGGKERDRQFAVATTPFELAKSLYFATQKNIKPRDMREGVDYYATPEPLGLKMVEFANVGAGSRILEPSAGHGAILRWAPENATVHFVEMSDDLASQAAMSAPHAKHVGYMFEDLHAVNKYDAIVMNPPFGRNGKTAVDHFLKALGKHTKPGSRVVAIIPDGSAYKKIQETLSDPKVKKDVLVVADIKLPSVAFERAGTKAMTRLLVVERNRSADEIRKEFSTIEEDLSHINNINDFFEAIKNLELPPKFGEKSTSLDEAETVIKTAGAKVSVIKSFAESRRVDLSEVKPKASGGEPLFVVFHYDYVGKSTFDEINKLAKHFGGRYMPQKKLSMTHETPPMANGARPLFAFKEKASADSFMSILNAYSESADSAKQADEEIRFADSKGVRTGGVSYERALKIANRIRARVKSPKVYLHVVRNFYEIDPEVRKRAWNMTGRERGLLVYDDKTGAAQIFVLSENHSSELDIEETIFHELVGHYGIRQILGNGYRSKLRQIYREIGGENEVRRLAGKYGFNVDSYLRKREGLRQSEIETLLIDELLAHIAEDYTQGSIARTIKEIVGAVVRFLRAHGFKFLPRLPEYQLLSIVGQANRRIGRSRNEVVVIPSIERSFSPTLSQEVKAVAMLNEEAEDGSIGSMQAKRIVKDFLGDWYFLSGAKYFIEAEGQLVNVEALKNFLTGKTNVRGQLSGDEFVVEDLSVEGIDFQLYDQNSRIAEPGVARAIVRGIRSGANKIVLGEKFSEHAAAKVAKEFGLKYETRDNGYVVIHTNDAIVDAVDESLPLLRDEPDAVYSIGYESLGDKNVSLMEKARKTYIRWLFPGGLLPQNVFKEKIVRDSNINVFEHEIGTLLFNLDRAVKEEFGVGYDDLDAATKKKLNDALVGNEHDDIPQKVLIAVRTMRISIDMLSIRLAKSMQEAAIELGKQRSREALKKLEMMKIILENLGSYVHRSYRAFDDPDWPKKVPKDVYDRAVKFLEKQYSNLGGLFPEDAKIKAAQVVKTLLEDGTAYDDMISFVREGKLGAKDLSVLKHRKEIAPEIRALLGEYDDVKINYAKTVTKMARLVFNDEFLRKLKEIGFREGWLFTEDTRPIDKRTVRIAAPSTESYSPLNGLYVLADIDTALRDALGKENFSSWYRMIVQWNGIVKYGKVVLSPTTQARNFISAMFFSLANGHFNFKYARDALRSIKQEIAHHGGDEQYIRYLIRLGVIYDNPYAKELSMLLSDSRLETLLFDKKGFRWMRGLNEFARQVYTHADNFWKIIGFENERRMLMKYKGMSYKEASAEAAERIRNTYPTYSMVGKGVRALARFPLMGTFVSFPAEILRTSYHIVRYLKQDMKDSPQYALRKAVGLAIMSSGMFALQEIAKAMVGMTDEEEEAYRILAPPWQENSNILPIGRDAKGNLRVIDVSFMDPYNYFKRPINALLRNQDPTDEIVSGIRDMIAPFFGIDIVASAIYEVLANRKRSGGHVFNEQAPPLEQIASISKHLYDAIKPGVMSNVERFIAAARGEVSPSGKKYTIGDEAAALFGFRVSTMDAKAAIYYRTYEFKEAIRNASNLFMRAVRSTKKLSDKDVKDAYRNAIKARAEAFEQIRSIAYAAMSAGVSRQEVIKILIRSGVSRRDALAIINGDVPDWRPSTRTLRNVILTAEALLDENEASEIKRRIDAYRDAAF